jgi:pyridoxal phosphate enzyme (YggS family)
MGIAEALERVRENIHKSAGKAGRDPDEIKLVAVSKTVTLEGILEAVKAGATILGENRVQEARDKIKQITDHRSLFTPPIPPLSKGGAKGGIEWHLIGNLQKNKAKTAVQLFDLIHSVDSIELARTLNNCARKIDKKQRILVQVNLSEEETKHGIVESVLPRLCEEISVMDNLNLQGLMTMPPYFEDADRARPYFKRLRKIRDDAEKKGYSLPELSMGMTNDYEAAIEEGSTMIRVGTAIFGSRQY